jgi:hypothetical protein
MVVRLRVDVSPQRHRLGALVPLTDIHPAVSRPDCLVSIGASTELRLGAGPDASATPPNVALPFTPGATR